MSPLEINIDELLSRIDYRVSLAVRRGVVCYQDAADLRQDIFLALFSRIQDFDSRLSSWATFTNMIIESEIRQFRLQKRWRKYQPFASIDNITETEHPLTNFYPTNELNDIERELFWREFDNALDKLPSDVHEICQELKRCPKVIIAAKLNVPVCKLSRQINKIRRLFETTKIFRDFIS
jgi:RNA polymerase sigma factor (sigma-70 family)